MTTTIKIIYAEAIRQINFTSPPTWTEFTHHIRALYHIPDTEPILVTYVDSEGDVISLDTDQELTDALRAQQTRFEVTTQHSLPNYTAVSEMTAPSATSERSAEASSSEKIPPLPPYNYDDPPIVTPGTSSSSSLPAAFSKFATDLSSLVGSLVSEIRNHPELINSAGELAREVGRQTWIQVEPLVREYRESGYGQGRGRGGFRGRGWDRGGFWGGRGHHHGWNGSPGEWGGWGANRGRGWGGGNQQRQEDGGNWAFPWSGFWQGWQSAPETRFGPTDDEKITQLKDMGFGSFEDSFLRNALNDRGGDMRETISFLVAEKERLAENSFKKQ